MKLSIGIIQPPYPGKDMKAEEVLIFILSEIQKITTPLDIIVLPEYSNCPGIIDYQEMVEFSKVHTEPFMNELKELALAKDVSIAVNLWLNEEQSSSNQTMFINKDGEIQAFYRKVHPTPLEIEKYGVVPGEEMVYFDFPIKNEEGGYDALRIAFLTCYDIFFPEYAERIGSVKPHVIIFPTYQRSADEEMIKIQTRARAFDTDSFIIRSSYSMGSSSLVGGCSMVVDPYGRVILEARQKTGLFYCQINPEAKKTMPFHLSEEKMDYRETLEKARRPSLYRKSGSSCRAREIHYFPRIIAHRGLSGLVPENTLPAFQAALALGVEEIEFDVRGTVDGELVIIHDPDLRRTSEREGSIEEMSLEEIQRLDAGVWFGERWVNFRYSSLEEIFHHFAGEVIMNIHVKDPGENGWIIKKITDLVYRYHIEEEVYIAGYIDVLQWALETAPKIHRCCLEKVDILDYALQYECRRVQFWNKDDLKNFNQDTIDRAHENQIICNAYFADTCEEAERLFAMGIDAVLSNYANIVMPTAQKQAKYFFK